MIVIESTFLSDKYRLDIFFLYKYFSVFKFKLHEKKKLIQFKKNLNTSRFEQRQFQVHFLKKIHLVPIK